MMTLPLSIALAQINPTVGAVQANADLVLESWTKVPADDDLVIFPELVISGYPPEDLVLKPLFLEHVRNAIEYICVQSKNFKSAALIGCPWVEDDKIYNALHLIEDGEIKATIYKHHLPNYGVFDEQRIFSRGPLPAPIAFRDTMLGVMICEDMWHADVSAHLKKEGAEILITANASPFESDKIDTRGFHATNRVRETKLPLIYTNQIGGQDELVFDGHSFVMDAKADITFQAPGFESGVFSLRNAQSTDENPIEEKIYKACVLGLRDYIEKNNFPGILLGLSGGVDSALAAVIAVDAIGHDRVHPLMMPSRYTSKESLDDAQLLAENLGVQLQDIAIENSFHAFQESLGLYLPRNFPPVTLENLQSRSRGVLLMALSNATGNMVLSTGNKSEMAVGYATLYGDMCGGFNPLKDLYKTQLYALCAWRNTQGTQPVIPERILTKAPTAELKDNQTDQDSLPPYDILDTILIGLIEKEMSVDQLVMQGHARETVLRVWKMLDRAEYKRRQAPPGVKVTSKAFGRDRRYPITNGFVNLIEKNGARR